jgi:hypothetical protein
MEFVAPEPPLNILLLPHGVYGISYDIFIRKSEDDLPNGWHSPRGELVHAPFISNTNYSL